MLIFLLFINLFGHYSIPNVETLKRAIEAGCKENYATGESLLSEYTNKVKDSPFGPLFYAGLCDIYMLDFSDDTKKKEFFKSLDLAIKRANKIIEKGKNRDRRELAWAYFSKGSALSYKAMFYGRKKKLIKALYYAFPAHKALLKAVEIDSTLYDVYLPLGAFDYALTELPKFVRWISGVKDKRDEALNEMRLAADKGEFVKIIAQDALAWTLAYHRSFREAERISRNLVKRYPASRSFRWTLTYILRRSGQWRKAYLEYKKLLYLITKEQSDYPYCLAIAYMWLSRSEYFTALRKTSRRDAFSGLVLTSKVKNSSDRKYLLKNFYWVIRHTGG